MSWKGQCGDRLCFPYEYQQARLLILNRSCDVHAGPLLCFDLFFSSCCFYVVVPLPFSLFGFRVASMQTLYPFFCLRTC